MYDSYDLMKARLTALGGSQEGRLQQDKLKTLLKALKYSYQAETVVKDDIEYRALILNNKLTLEFDNKIISIPFDSQFKVGDVFYWPKTGEHWIIYLCQFSEDAYFRGFIRKAAHLIKWKDEFGNIHETWAAVRGPVETKIVSDTKSGITFDTPNYTLNVLMPCNDATRVLQRYSKIMMDNVAWEVATSDCVSEPGIIELNLIENYKNKDEDTRDVAQGLIKEDIVVNTSLDNLYEILTGYPVDLWTNITIDGNKSDELTKNARFEIVEGDVQFKDGKMIVGTESLVKVALKVPKIDYHKVFELSAIDKLEAMTVELDIIGNELVKSFGKTKYTIAKYANGIKVPAEGQWILKNNPELFEIVSADRDFVEFKWINGRTGVVELGYKDEEIQKTKIIKVESLI